MGNRFAKNETKNNIGENKNAYSFMDKIKNDDIELYNQLLPYYNKKQSRIEIKIYVNTIDDDVKCVCKDELDYNHDNLVSNFIIHGSLQIGVFCEKILKTGLYVTVFHDSRDFDSDGVFFNLLSECPHIPECKALYGLLCYKRDLENSNVQK